MSLPAYQDRVRHSNPLESVTGTVIAVFTATRIGLEQKDVTMLDVRTDDDKIIYSTPAENWITVSTEEENFE